MYEPVIKWSGSKRSQAQQILQYFPNQIDTYYEPFCGGASVLRRLLDSPIEVKHYVCSDINQDLIGLWNYIKDSPHTVAAHYEQLWNELNIDNDKERKKEYFNLVRQRYNTEHNPLDFMFIMRTTVNGMPRYNSNGEFNNTFHVTRNGIIPSKFERIVAEWSSLLSKYNVEFYTKSYTDVSPSKNNFMYLDPPYANTKGMYYGIIDYGELWNYLREQPCRWILSFDGISGDVDNTQSVPTDLYDKHEYILNGNSSFKRVIGKSLDSVVRESIYIKE